MTAIHDEADNQLHQRTLDGFREQGYEVLDASAEQGSSCAITGRANDSEVVLTERLHQALRRLNPAVSQDLLEQAREQLTQNYSLRELAAANQDVYRLLTYGIKLDIASPAAAQVRGTSEEKVTVQVIDWKNPQNNNFLLVTGLSINGQLGRGRLDYVGFVNGLPLLLPVVRASGRQQDRLRRLYDLVEKDYKQRFPQLFWYNALILLSDGQHSKMGSMATTWEHFVEWKRVEREDEPENTTLETLLKGTCARGRLLDIVENFTLFKPVAGGLLKIVARCHQYLGVNAAFARMQRIKELDGKIGVFWHTQGAGKSYSMIFFEQKVQHKLSGNWTFVVVTDREDLDKQIYENFAQIGVISEPQERVRATSRDELKRLLRENHSIIFTLIQKFQTEQPQQPYPKLSDRDDIIVMTDEAHRSQYDTLAANMRTALPNASFIGFTGTPLIDREEHETRETFGPYISKYPFLQAIRDGVTVPLIYENRTPEIELQVAEVAEAIQEMERRTGLS
ncbi:MAG: type I restriction endonuclease subunit R, partial [Ktedonobacteraceae bacterium]|nr:type I restriction endonuclease subunit R [Ktedonobacteraceae bacterium]